MKTVENKTIERIYRIDLTISLFAKYFLIINNKMNRFFPLLLSVIVLLATFGCSTIKLAHHEQNFSDTEEFAKLIAIAKKRGVVKVIVRLKVPEIDALTRSAAQLKDPVATAQADQEIATRITAVADSVLNLIKNTRHSINHRYDSLPLLALEASVEALRILRSSPDVLNITEDRPIPLH